MYSVAYKVASGHKDEISAPNILDIPSILKETVYLSTNLNNTTPASGGLMISFHATIEVIIVIASAITSMVLRLLTGVRINNTPANIGKNMAK